MLQKHTQPLSLSLSVLFLTFIIFLQFSIILLSGIAAQATPRYVMPRSDAVVRRGQGTEYKIVAMVKDGTLVELLEENEDFAKIQLSNGKEGWILKRFLSVEPPMDQLVVSLRAQNEDMHQRELETNQQLDAVSTILTKTEQERDRAISERDQILASYKQLKVETADIVQINNDMQKTSQENKTLKQKLALLEEENDRLRKDATFKWFLAGGGVLFLGMLMGRITGGSRKKRQSLLS